MARLVVMRYIGFARNGSQQRSYIYKKRITAFRCGAFFVGVERGKLQLAKLKGYSFYSDGLIQLS